MAKRRGRPPGSKSVGRAGQAAESFSAMLGNVAAKVDRWLEQREDIARELDTVITRAQGMLAALGGRGDRVAVSLGRGAKQARSVARRDGGSEVGSGPADKKRRTMSPEARAKIAAAQRARWAKQKGETSGASAKNAKSAKAKKGTTAKPA